MTGLPPGNILQYIYLSQRLDYYQKKGFDSFLKIGSGNGNVSNIFLKKGFRGLGFDLNKSACDNNKLKNGKFIKDKKYRVLNDNFIDKGIIEKYDIIISCMVIEHMPTYILKEYFEKCKKVLSEKGVIITLVPSSMKHWGIEDDIAGHVKRYEFEDINNLGPEDSFKVIKNVGLTYPLSNIFLSLSNSLIKKSESDKLKLSQQEKTIYTGNRDVKFKTTFPSVFNIVLNPVVMYPFYLLQLLFSKKLENLVIYSELQNK